MGRKRWSLGERIAGISISAVLIFIVTAAIAGIIGNSADTLFIWLWDLLIKINAWPWTIILVTMVIGFALVLFVVWRNGGALRIQLRTLNDALDTMQMLVALDDTLLRLLANWMPAQDREGGIRRLFTYLLRDATAAFTGEVHRAVIFLPDATREYLRAWVHYQMPQESLDRSVFYIGKNGDDRKRGIAGETFIEGKLLVAHILRSKDYWKCDSEHYIDFDKTRPYPPYKSLISIPIIGINPNAPNSNATTCLGVICFDSEDPTIFDYTETKRLLLGFGSRIAAALLIYEQFPKPDAP